MGYVHIPLLVPTVDDTDANVLLPGQEMFKIFAEILSRSSVNGCGGRWHPNAFRPDTHNRPGTMVPKQSRQPIKEDKCV